MSINTRCIICNAITLCFVYSIPHSLSAVALLCIHLPESISSAGTADGKGRGPDGGPGPGDGLVQDGARNHETAGDGDNRLCAA